MFGALPIIGIVIFFGGIVSSLVGGRLTSGSLILFGGAMAFCVPLARRSVYRRIHRMFFATLLIFSLLGCFVVIHLFLMSHPYRIDLTENRIFTLSPQSQKVLKELDSEVKLVAFVSSDTSAIERLLDEYDYQSPYISSEIHDPRNEPLAVLEYTDTLAGPDTLFVATDDRTKRVDKVDEEGITNAIIDIIRPFQPSVYFLSGHGEKRIELKEGTEQTRGELRNSISVMVGELHNQSYKTGELNLAQTGVIPDDCDVLIIAGPTSDLFAGEERIISNYIRGGGSCLLLLDPVTIQLKTDRNFTSLVDDFNVSLDESLVLDISLLGRQGGGNYATPLVSNFSDHPITKDLRGLKESIAFPFVRPIILQPFELPGTVVTPLLSTHAKSWSESVTKAMANQQIKTPTQDRLKAQTVAVAIVKKVASSGNKPGKSDEGRLVIVGDSDTFSDSDVLGRPISRLFFSNCVKWLIGEEYSISIPPRRRTETPITMTELDFRFLFLILVIIPVLTISVGLGYTMIRRRNR